MRYYTITIKVREKGKSVGYSNENEFSQEEIEKMDIRDINAENGQIGHIPDMFYGAFNKAEEADK